MMSGIDSEGTSCATLTTIILLRFTLCKLEKFTKSCMCPVAQNTGVRFCTVVRRFFAFGSLALPENSRACVHRLVHGCGCAAAHQSVVYPAHTVPHASPPLSHKHPPPSSRVSTYCAHASLIPGQGKVFLFFAPFSTQQLQIAFSAAKYACTLYGRAGPHALMRRRLFVCHRNRRFLAIFFAPLPHTASYRPIHTTRPNRM